LDGHPLPGFGVVLRWQQTAEERLEKNAMEREALREANFGKGEFQQNMGSSI